LHLLLTTEDRAPLAVLGNRHSAFDTNANPGLWRGAVSEQSLEQGHVASVIFDTLDAAGRFPVVCGRAGIEQPA
jgi:hypothetical protein